MQIERGEWKSYKIHYVYTIETGDVTGYLTTIGDQRFLDVTLARGEDRGSFLIPVHAILRVRLEGDTLQLTPFGYDWFYDRVSHQKPVPGLAAVLDQKQNALIVAPTPALRAWIRGQPLDGPMFGAAATFVRNKEMPADGRAGLSVKRREMLYQQRLRLQPRTNVRGCASGGGAPRALKE